MSLTSKQKEGRSYPTEEIPKNIDDSTEDWDFKEPCGESPAMLPASVFYEVEKTKLRPSGAVDPEDFKESGKSTAWMITSKIEISLRHLSYLQAEIESKELITSRFPAKEEG